MTFAVAVSVIVFGEGPQSKVTTPPLATAATNASDVQLSGVPVPTTVVGFATLSAAASAGTAHFPVGLPAAGPSSGLVGGPPLAPELPPPEDPPGPPLVPGDPLLAPLGDPPPAPSLEHAERTAAPPTITTKSAREVPMKTG
jgi:hypothetical protein